VREGESMVREVEAMVREVESVPRDVEAKANDREVMVRDTSKAWGMKARTEEASPGLRLPKEAKLVATLGPPPVAQVAPVPRVLQVHHPPMEPLHPPQLTPIVDMHGSPMLDATTGHPLVAAPVQQQQVQYLTGADGGLYLQPGAQLQIMAQVPAMVQQPPQQQQQIVVAGLQAGTHQLIVQPGPIIAAPVPANIQVELPQAPPPTETQRREIKHELSPEIASKSLSALKDRKEEILSELGDIVGSTAATAIGDLASQQAATREKYSIEPEPESPDSRRSSEAEGDQGEPQNAGTYGIWTSKPLVTMNMLTAMAGSRHTMQNKKVEVEPLPEGICVSRFGPISRKQPINKNYSEPTAVTAGFGLNTRSTSTCRQPLPATSPVPDSLMMVQDQHTILQFPETAAVYEYDPGFPSTGYYPDFVHSNIQEGRMESVSMSHLVNPPYTPMSPLPDPRDQTASSVRLNSQNLSMAAESARIQKELSDLQRRISCLTVAENSNQMAMKRDRLAIELRMIESGIRERHQEITQNQTYPHSDTGDEISTEYTYW